MGRGIFDIGTVGHGLLYIINSLLFRHRGTADHGLMQRFAVWY